MRLHIRLAILIPMVALVVAPLLGTALTTSTRYYGEPVLSIGDFVTTQVEIPFIAVSLAYGLFPILYNKFGFFIKHSEYIAREYRTVTKILWIEIPLLAILTLYYLLFSPMNLEALFPAFDLFTFLLGGKFSYYVSLSFFNLMYFMLYSVLGGLLWIALIKINKDFYFYLAKGCFENILEKNEIGKIQSMTRGLRYYNGYLEKILKLKINNIDGVISKLLSDSKVDKREAIKSIYHAFEENDRFQPIACISTTLAIQETENFLARQPVAEKIKNWTAYIIATIIPFIVSTIKLLFPSALQ